MTVTPGTVSFEIWTIMQRAIGENDVPHLRIQILSQVELYLQSLQANRDVDNPEATISRSPFFYVRWKGIFPDGRKIARQVNLTARFEDAVNEVNFDDMINGPFGSLTKDDHSFLVLPESTKEEKTERHHIKVTFSDGDYIHSTINGTRKDILEYYLDKWFNVGFGPGDNMKQAKEVHFLVEAIEQPLTTKDMDPDGWVKGVVAVELSEVISRDVETFLDLLSTRLVGNDLLMDVDYNVVGHHNDILFIEVCGDARTAFGLEDMVEKVEWTPEDSAKAMEQGWEIFQSDRDSESEEKVVDGKPYGHRPFELQALDDGPLAGDDNKAWEIVRAKFIQGDPTILRAAVFLKQHSPNEYEAIFGSAVTNKDVHDGI